MWGSGDSSINWRLLLDMAECTDSDGNPLFDNRIVSIWEEERKHVWCLQDPERVALYTVTGHVTKGDGAASAPLCKRYYLTGIIPTASGQLCNISIILWSFSNCYNPPSSLLRFIPGSSASNLHYQEYLLEGLSTWNPAWALAATQQQDSQLQTFNLQLANKVDVFDY